MKIEVGGDITKTDHSWLSSLFFFSFENKLFINFSINIKNEIVTIFILHVSWIMHYTFDSFSHLLPLLSFYQKNVGFLDTEYYYLFF